jgi:hypothetical protein
MTSRPVTKLWVNDEEAKAKEKDKKGKRASGNHWASP